MKLKKSLLALTTAATVAVAGTTAAVAEENNGANNSSTETITGSLKKKQDGENGNNNDGEPGKKDIAGSAQDFFGWKDGASTVDKLAKVTLLVTTVAALVGGIVTLFNNFQKLGKLVK